MDVEVRILNATVTVQEQLQCYVKWTRGSQSINTGKKMLTTEEPKVTFDAKSAKFKINCSLY